MFKRIKGSKYGSNKTIIDGHKFDSKLEASFYVFFRDNGINILEFQPRFLLQEAFVYDGEPVRKIEYVADFLIEIEGDKYYVDSKGFKTSDFKIKHKIWKRKFGGENRLLVVKSINELKKIIL